MNTTTCAVHKAVHNTEDMDGLPKLLPMPKSIKAQMPQFAAMLADTLALASVPDAATGLAIVQAALKNSMAIRAAYQADDFAALKACYKGTPKPSWFHALENSCQFGVPDMHIAAMTKRHRLAQKAAA
jgi:hypothetical protein